MGSRTKEMINKIMLLHNKTWTRRKIAKECGVSPQYVAKLINLHQQMQSGSVELDYGLCTRILNCLKRNHIPVDARVIAGSIDQLLCMRGIGMGSLKEIGAVLKRLDIIYDIDEWIEEGKRKKYNQSQTSLGKYFYDQPRYDRPTMRI